MLSSHLRAAEISRKLTRSRWLALLLPLIGIATVLFAVLILLISLSYRGLQDQFEREAEVQVLESARIRAEQLSAELKGIHSLGLLLAGQVRQQLASAPRLSHPGLLEALTYNSDGRIYNSDQTQAAIHLSTLYPRSLEADQAILQQLLSLSPLLSDIYLSHELVSQVYVNTRKGETVIYPWIDVLHQFPAAVDIQNYPFYYLADAAHNPELEPVWTDVYLDPAGTGWMVSLILPVVINERVEAVVGLDLTLDSLMKRLMRMSVPWDGYTLLMADDGTLLTFPVVAEKDWGLLPPDFADPDVKKNNFLQQADLHKTLEPLRLDTAGLLPISLNSRDVLLSWSTLQGTGWKLLQVTPADTVFAIKKKLEEDYYSLLWLGALFPALVMLFMGLLAVRRDQLLVRNLLDHEPSHSETYPAVVSAADTSPESAAALDWLQLINGPLLICRFDAAERILACNSAFELFAGEPGISLRGQRLRDLPGFGSLSWDDLPQEVELYPDQQEPVHYWISRHVTEQGDGVLLLLDVDHYAHLQQQLRSERQRVQQAARMKAEFFQVASRDAYQLLGELQQNARTLDSASASACQQKLVAIQRLLDDMRDMSEESEVDEVREAVEDCFNLAQLVTECHAASEGLLSHTGRELKVDFDPNIPAEIQADRRRLGRLLKHLLRQASQFSERGDLHLLLSWSAPNHLVLRFIDQGGGASEAERLKHFQSSTPLGSSYDSGSNALGLGQLLTRQLVQEMRGSLDIKARVDGGLQIMIELPVQPVNQPQPHVRVLVVDDGPVNSMLAASVLEKSGYLVDAASSGMRALELGREKLYDLLLMDIYMPGMDGIETTRRWRKLSNANAGIPVIALTAHALESDRARFIEEGLDDYLAKPYRPAELRERVSYWLNRKRGDS